MSWCITHIVISLCIIFRRSEYEHFNNVWMVTVCVSWCAVLQIIQYIPCLTSWYLQLQTLFQLSCHINLIIKFPTCMKHLLQYLPQYKTLFQIFSLQCINHPLLLTHVLLLKLQNLPVLVHVETFIYLPIHILFTIDAASSDPIFKLVSMPLQLNYRHNYCVNIYNTQTFN